MLLQLPPGGALELLALQLLLLVLHRLQLFHHHVGAVQAAVHLHLLLHCPGLQPAGPPATDAAAHKWWPC
jgi:hypothetical protein